MLISDMVKSLLELFFANWAICELYEWVVLKNMCAPLSETQLIIAAEIYQLMDFG